MKLRRFAPFLLLLTALPAAAQEMVTVCHAPPRNPRSLRTVEVRARMLRLHIAHGDTLGACGCQSDDACPSGTFCESSRGICGGRGRCRVLRDPCRCPQVDAPVCGCDGRSYRNSCEARCAGVSLLNPGGACCQNSGDCRPARTRCGECGCRGMPLAAPDPRCGPGEAIVCATDPCRDAIAVCQEGNCVTASGDCGGSRGFLCPAGRACIDDPRDGCDPLFGESCPGVCAGQPSTHRNSTPVPEPDLDLGTSAEPAASDATEARSAPSAE